MLELEESSLKLHWGLGRDRDLNHVFNTEKTTTINKTFLCLNFFNFLYYLSPVFSNVPVNSTASTFEILLQVTYKLPTILKVVLQEQICLVLWTTCWEGIHRICHILEAVLELW